MSRKRRRRNARPKQAASEHNGRRGVGQRTQCSSGRTTENFAREEFKDVRYFQAAYSSCIIVE